jgi:hypothetical protein
MSSQEISTAQELLLQWLRQAEHPVSPRDLLQRDRPEGVSALGIRSALWGLVDSGAARLTSDRQLEPTIR